jgi:hypothetical protein
MESKKFINFCKQHLTPISEPSDCCICINPSDNQTKKCNHPMCKECFYKLTDNETKNIPCPIYRQVVVKRRRTNKKKKIIMNENINQSSRNENIIRMMRSNPYMLPILPFIENAPAFIPIGSVSVRFNGMSSSYLL